MPQHKYDEDRLADLQLRSRNERRFNELSREFDRHVADLYAYHETSLFSTEKWKRLHSLLYASAVTDSKRLSNLTGLVNMLREEVRRVKATRKLLGLDEPAMPGLYVDVTSYGDTQRTYLTADGQLYHEDFDDIDDY